MRAYLPYGAVWVGSTRPGDPRSHGDGKKAALQRGREIIIPQTLKEVVLWPFAGNTSQGGVQMIFTVLSVIGSLCSILGLVATVCEIYISNKKK